MEAKAFDNVLSSLPAAFFSKLSQIQNDPNKPYFLQQLASFFNITDRNRTSSRLNLGEASKEQVARFDGVVRKTIVTVIPSLLSKILHVLDTKGIYGRSELVFDHETGRFRAKDELTRVYQEQRRAAVMQGFSDFHSGFEDELTKDITDYERAQRIREKARIQMAKVYERIAQKGYFDKNDPELFFDVDYNLKGLFDSYFKANPQIMFNLQRGILDARTALNKIHTQNELLNAESAKFHHLFDTEDLIGGKLMGKGRNNIGKIRELEKQYQETLQQQEERIRRTSLSDLHINPINVELNRQRREIIEGELVKDPNTFTGALKALYRMPFDIASNALNQFNRTVAWLFFGEQGEEELYGINKPGMGFLKFLKKGFDKVFGVRTAESGLIRGREGGLIQEITKLVKDKLIEPSLTFLIGAKSAEFGGKRVGGLLDRWFKSLDKAIFSKLFGEYNAEIGKREGGLFRKWKDEINVRLFGGKVRLDNEDQVYETKGIFGGMKDKFKGLVAKSRDFLFGKKDDQGNLVGDKGLFGKIYEWLKTDIFDPIKSYVITFRNDLMNSLVDPLGRRFDKFTDFLFGKDSGKRDEKYNTIIREGGLFSGLANTVTKAAKSIETYLFGEKVGVDEYGLTIRQGGLFNRIWQTLRQEFFNPLTDWIKYDIYYPTRRIISENFTQFRQFLFGKGQYLDPETNQMINDRGLVGKIVDWWNSPRNDFRKFLFGEKDQNDQIIKKGLFGNIVEGWNELKARTSIFLFGLKDKDGSYIIDPETGQPMEKGLMTKVWEKFREITSKTGEYLFGKYDKDGNRIKDGFLSGIVDFIDDEIWKPFKKTVKEDWIKIKSFFKEKVFDRLGKDVFQPFIDEFKHQMSVLGEWTKTMWQGVLEKVNNSFKKEFGDALTGLIKKYLLDPIKGVLKDTKNAIGEVLGSIIKAPVDIINNISNDLRNKQAKRGGISTSTTPSRWNRMVEIWKEIDAQNVLKEKLKKNNKEH